MQTIRMDSEDTAELDERQSERLWAEVETMTVLDRTLDAQLTVRSIPEDADVSIDGIHTGKTPLSIALRPGHHRLRVWRDGETRVEALDVGQGDVVVRRYELSSTAIEESTSYQGDTPDPTSFAAQAPSPTARQMLDRAQHMRAERRFQEASEAFRELLVRYPRSAEASTCLVSLANIELNALHRPRSSLHLYERYLSTQPNGVLSQEALFGKARALRALGRQSDEVRVLRQYLQLFPNAIRAKDAQDRLSDLSGD
jgi:TolA-binding protein